VTEIISHSHGAEKEKIYSKKCKLAVKISLNYDIFLLHKRNRLEDLKKFILIGGSCVEELCEIW